jgi:hypothetical protein
MASGELPSQKRTFGRLILPDAREADIPVTLSLEWDRRPPDSLRLDAEFIDAEGQDQLKKKIKIKAKAVGSVWQQSVLFHFPGHSVRRFALTSRSQDPTVTRYSFTAFASSPALRILRLGEMLFYPALALVLFALVMVLFPSFISS